MARYIDAERMPNDSFWEGLTDKEKAKVLQWLLQSPTADVVEVVRCKDCKFYERYSIYDDDYYCMAEHTQSLFSPNKTDYCSYGERSDT